jgi:hypothetical protein
MLHLLIRVTHRLYIALRRLERVGVTRRLTASISFDELPRHRQDAKRLLQRYLDAADYATMTEFAERFPKATLARLARDLGLPVNMYWAVGDLLLREAEERGAVGYHVRSLIVRQLLNHTVSPPHSDIGKAGIENLFEVALITVAASLPHRYRAACYEVARAHASTNLPSMWTPVDADDIELQELFSYWDTACAKKEPARTTLADRLAALGGVRGGDSSC